MKSRVAVMHMVDTLSVGGAERMAVNIVNSLPRDRFRAHLCCTRHDGPLGALVDDDVVRLTLGRTHRFDVSALARLVAHIREHDVRVLHAHSTAVFAAVLASLAPPHPAVVWHDHYGRSLGSRTAWPYRAVSRRLFHVIAVNEPLAHWARSTMGVPSGRVSYIPNFVAPASPAGHAVDLAGRPDRRVACVANLRPQKDHATLIAAFARVVAAVPDAQLLLMGAESDTGHAAALRRAVDEAGIAANVSWLGVRDDVAQVLRACSVGVLSSLSEGLPLALLEYGQAGLPSVATRVGQCDDVLNYGNAGVIVPASDPVQLAAALIALLQDEPRRNALGEALRLRVAECYGAARAVASVSAIYENVLEHGRVSVRAYGETGRVTRKTPNAGLVDGATVRAPMGDGGFSGVIGSETLPPA